MQIVVVVDITCGDGRWTSLFARSVEDHGEEWKTLVGLSMVGKKRVANRDSEFVSGSDMKLDGDRREAKDDFMALLGQASDGPEDCAEARYKEGLGNGQDV
jgi:hypothetical protein